MLTAFPVSTSAQQCAIKCYLIYAKGVNGYFKKKKKKKERGVVQMQYCFQRIFGCRIWTGCSSAVGAWRKFLQYHAPTDTVSYWLLFQVTGPTSRFEMWRLNCVIPLGTPEETHLHLPLKFCMCGMFLCIVAVLLVELAHDCTPPLPFCSLLQMSSLHFPQPCKTALHKVPQVSAHSFCQNAVNLCMRFHSMV